MLYSRCTHVVPHRNVSSWAAGFAEDGLVCVRHRDPREPHWPACLAPNNQVSSPCAAMRLRRHVMCSLGSRCRAPFSHGDVRSHRTMLELWEAEFDTVCKSLDRSFTNRHLHACVYTRMHMRAPIHTFVSMPQSSFDPLAERLDTRCPAAAWDALNDAVRTLHRMTRQCLESNRRRRAQARGSYMRASIACVRVCLCAYACVLICWQLVPVRDTESLRSACACMRANVSLLVVLACLRVCAVRVSRGPASNAVWASLSLCRVWPVSGSVRTAPVQYRTASLT